MSRLLWYPGHDLLLTDIVRAENCSLYDSAGRRWVDLESGVWCTSIGHGHPRVLRVLSEQASRISHAGYVYEHPIVEEAAREVLALLDLEDGSCVFLCSGSEAVEYGVRAARMVAGRPLFITMADSYFGAYGSAHARRAAEWHLLDWSACAACPHARACGPDCPVWASIPHDEIAGFLFEPGSSSGFVRFPPEKLVTALARTVQESGGVVIVNEVTTGIGRTGRWFGYQHYQIRPDVVAIGKGLGNGYPVSVAAFASGVVDRLGGRPVPYSQSHQNDPLGAAIALEVIRTIEEENLIERGRQIAERLLQGLSALRERSDRIRDVRARGLMIALELEDDAEGSFAARAHRALIDQGYIVARRPGTGVFRIDPALTVERRDIEDFLQVLEETLRV